jgi:hypothetical protein
VALAKAEEKLKEKEEEKEETIQAKTGSCSESGSPLWSTDLVINKIISIMKLLERKTKELEGRLQAAKAELVNWGEENIEDE